MKWLLIILILSHPVVIGYYESSKECEKVGTTAIHQSVGKFFVFNDTYQYTCLPIEVMPYTEPATEPNRGYGLGLPIPATIAPAIKSPEDPIYE